MIFNKQLHQQACIDNLLAAITEDNNKLIHNLNPLYEQAPHLKGRFESYSNNTFNQLDVLMETGTGKTFTYLQLAFELNKKLGKNRFIFVIPKVAIKQGIIQQVQLTKAYFLKDYGLNINIINYPEDGLSAVTQQFIKPDNNIQIMLTTASAFNKDNNVIQQPSEHAKQQTIYGKRSIWNDLTHTAPVVVIDEPHLLTGEQTTKALADFKESLFIRFGATYPSVEPKRKIKAGEMAIEPTFKATLTNVVYGLDSVEAFKTKLVKAIRVNTLLNANSNGYSLIETNSRKKNFELSFFKNNEPNKVIVGLKQDIGLKTGLAELNGYEATKIIKSSVFITNGTDNKQLIFSSGQFEISDEESRKMIRSTIQNHFKKEEHLFKQGLKTLSLFFIPNISDFRGDSPRLKRIFEEEYRTIRKQFYQATSNQAYKVYLDNDFDADGNLAVHEGYFSGDGKGKGKAEDKEKADIDLILNQKEQLLSFGTSLRFIFSVWALQEGWDNPNIFNICKLSNTSRDVSRRQQVGRGLRLAVDQCGVRMTYQHYEESDKRFYDVNTLDMVVSSHEQNFIHEIQNEIALNSYSILRSTFNIEELIAKGLNSRQACKILGILEDENIITYSDDEDTYTAQSSVGDFLDSNPALFSSIPEAQFNIAKEIFPAGISGLIDNGNKPKQKVIIRQDKLNKFKALWESINRKSHVIYQKLNQEKLIGDITTVFNQLTITTKQSYFKQERLNPETNEVERTDSIPVESDQIIFTATDYLNFIQEVTQESKLPLPFTFGIKLLTLLDKTKIQADRSKAKRELNKIIVDVIHSSMIQKVDYQFSSEVKITDLHDGDLSSYLTEIEYTKLGMNINNDDQAPDNLLFDKIVWDSTIERDVQKEKALKVNGGHITVFAKLPSIKIPTPYKTYSPDFAYLIEREGNKDLFLVVETKGYKSEQDIPVDEQNKIKYAERFFLQLQKELPDVQVEFKTRVNKQELIDLVGNI